MTLLSGQVCSPTDVLRIPIDLHERWWTALGDALALLRAVPTQRVNADQAKVTRDIRNRFGDDVDTTVHRWDTVHGDLHWNNLLGPDLALLDWELWGRGPAGADAATLLCFSLLVPEVADRIRGLFAEQLNTPTGQVAQRYVTARLLRRVDGGDIPELAVPLRSHAQRLMV